MCVLLGRIRASGRCWIPLLTVVVAFVTAPGIGTAALPLASFSEVHSTNPDDYGTYQLKFTYLGPQLKMVPTAGGVGIARAYEDSVFNAYERGLNYGNDIFTPDTLLVQPVEFQAFVDSIATVSGLQDTAFVPEPNASLMILRDSGPTEKCWEHLATRQETETLFQFLHDSLSDPAQREIVDRHRRMMAGVRR